jgi:hypothetical protein
MRPSSLRGTFLVLLLGACSSSSGGGPGSNGPSSDASSADSGDSGAGSDALVDSGPGDDAFGGSDAFSGSHPDSGHHADSGGDGAASDGSTGHAGDAGIDSAASDAASCNAPFSLGVPACDSCMQASCCSSLVACTSTCQSILVCAVNYANTGASLTSAIATCGGGAGTAEAMDVVNCMSSQCAATCP